MASCLLTTMNLVFIVFVPTYWLAQLLLQKLLATSFFIATFSADAYSNTGHMTQTHGDMGHMTQTHWVYDSACVLCLYWQLMETLN